MSNRIGAFQDLSGNALGNGSIKISPNKGNRHWLIHRMRILLTCDATVATRTIKVRLVNSDVGGADLQSPIMGANTTAGQAKCLSIQPASLLSSATFMDAGVIGIPSPMRLDRLNEIIISVDNGVAGDTVAVVYTRETTLAI